MKKLVFLIFILCSAAMSFAQQPLIIRSGSKGFYLEHKVTAKENFYSIGRLFNVHPKELAAYNGLDMSKGLSLGQSLKIPLTNTNFSQTADNGTAIYYKPADKEGLLKISQANNKVDVELLKKWNKLESDNIAADKPVIVGFLQLSPPAVVVKKESEAVIEEKLTPPTVTETKKEDVAVKEQVKEKPTKTEPKKETKQERGQGFFKTYFDQQVKSSPVSKNETVTAGIFKTTSGWDDAKYYMLIDGVQPGTIIKLINPGNNKAVYAKVLGEMSGIKQNEGYNVRISNAAASALAIEDEEKFVVKVNY